MSKASRRVFSARTLFTASLLTGALIACSTEAMEPPAVQPGGAPTAVRNPGAWNIDQDSKLAIQGYDPVAYFPEGGGTATKGDAKYAAAYRGVNYRFASEKNKEAFLANPARYEPAHGGWCSWAMREGDKVDIDPKSFIVKDGRLFLFYKGWLGDTRSKWLKGDHAAESKEADQNWKKLSGEEARSGEPAAAPMMNHPLQSKLDAAWKKASESLPETTRAAVERGVEDVRAARVAEHALKVGSTAPAFELPDATGHMKSLQSMLAAGPVVVTFYRGAWCPFCNIQLHEYQEMLPEITAAGGQLVAISPQMPDGSLSTAEKNGLQFAVLSDQGNAVARSFGVAYKLPADIAAAYKPMLTKANGGDGDELPLASTFVIDRSGMVAYAFVDSDFRKRAEPADVVAALKQVSGTK